MKVAIITEASVGNEHEVIRQCLEYFGAQISVFFIGRPQDLVDILSAKNEFIANFKYWILCMHGEEGKFILPELASDLYLKNEPRKNIEAAALQEICQFSGQVILTTACTMGISQIGEIFIKSGAMAYLGPESYIEGNAAVFFMIQFFYELYGKQRTLKEAFSTAKNTDKETNFFQLYLR